MKERKYKLFISKVTVQGLEARAEFAKGEMQKELHLDQLSDR